MRKCLQVRGLSSTLGGTCITLPVKDKGTRLRDRVVGGNNQDREAKMLLLTFVNV